MVNISEIKIINIWDKTENSLNESIAKMWKENFSNLTNEWIDERLKQVVFAVLSQDGSVIATTTSVRTYIKQLRHYFYNYRCFIDPGYRIPGLTSVLAVKTRDFLEEFHSRIIPPDFDCLGMITLVENDRFKKFRNEAVWPASGMVYIGNSSNGHPIRVYYFKKAMLTS